MIHVVPVGDLVEHRCSPSCWCVPTVDEDADLPIVIHQSADGRESVERLEDELRARVAVLTRQRSVTWAREHC